MTVSLSIKNVPDDVVERLRDRARRNRRSLQGELLDILEHAVPMGTVTVEELYRSVRERGLRTPSESLEMIREDRSR